MDALDKAPTRGLRAPAGRTPTSDPRAQYLAFTSGGETFAIDIRSVREVIQYGGLTEVPLMPSFIRGVINLRGAVVPVIDLGARLGRTGTEVGRRTCVVILEIPTGEDTSVVGIMVDSVNEVLDISSTEIDPAPSFGHDLRTEFISGVGKVNGRFVILLDVNYVLSIQEMASLAGNRDSTPG
ncbi:MAG: purine-binding chemotaxis protein CheW [Acidobacteria bacterium]|nr:purine-binding chemotaxis protein CheW [Acidobacteriota bacterium]